MQIKNQESRIKRSKMGPMTSEKSNTSSRRNFLKLAAGAAAFGPFFSFPERALASQKTLKIAKWAHFLPEFDQWFENVVAKQWGEKNDTKVKIDLVPVEEIRARALAEAKAGKGHDLFMFPWPPAEFWQHVIDHAEIYQAVAPKYGAIQQLAHRSTYNYKLKKSYFAFADFWMPTPVHYFQDYWGEIGMPLGPVHYGGLLTGGKTIRDKFGIPSGLAFTPTLEGNVTLHTMLYSHRAFIADPKDGSLLFNKNAFAGLTLRYIQSLYRDSGSPEQLTWGSGANVRAMVAHKASCSMNAISLVRTAEKENPEIAKKILLQPPLVGQSGMGVTALPHVTNCSSVWKFAENPEGAKKFLAELIDSSGAGYEQSKGCNFPIYPKTVPDLVIRLEKDPQAGPTAKYYRLKDALHWTPNLGVPGAATPEFMEIFTTSVIPRAVLRMLKGDQSPEDAAASAAAEMQKIMDKWKQITS
jgi:multiple sugar transport system substrate-binding protein